MSTFGRSFSSAFLEKSANLLSPFVPLHELDVDLSQVDFGVEVFGGPK